MSNDAADAKFDEWIRSLRTVGKAIPEMAQEVATKLHDEAKVAISEQRSMTGKPWPPTKSGKPALQGAAAALSTAVVGTIAVIKLSGKYVYHHFGAGRSGARGAREILPTGGLPKKLGNAIRGGIVDMGIEWMTRGGRHGSKFGKGAKPSV